MSLVFQSFSKMFIKIFGVQSYWIDSVLRLNEHGMLDACKTGDPGFCSVHRRSLLWYGERPNTELAHNSPFASRWYIKRLYKLESETDQQHSNRKKRSYMELYDLFRGRLYELDMLLVRLQSLKHINIFKC